MQGESLFGSPSLSISDRQNLLFNSDNTYSTDRRKQARRSPLKCLSPGVYVKWNYTICIKEQLNIENSTPESPGFMDID